jgi:hypothetical protein
LLNELIVKYKNDIFIIKGTINELEKNKKSIRIREEINFLHAKRLTLESVVKDLEKLAESAKYIK